MAPAKKCDFVKPDSKKCRCVALKDKTMCRHHQEHEPGEPEIVYGKMDDRGDPEDHCNPEFFKDYSMDELYNYVLNATGGRIELDMGRGLDHMVATAVEVLQ